MLRFVMKVVYRDFVKAEAAFDTRDYVLAKDLLAASKKRFGSLRLYEHLEARLKVERNKPDNKMRLRRGREYYRLIKLLETDSKSFHKRMKRFIEVDVNGYYSRMPAIMAIREEVLGSGRSPA